MNQAVSYDNALSYKSEKRNSQPIVLTQSDTQVVDFISVTGLTPQYL